jgi:hypothetical protein
LKCSTALGTVSAAFCLRHEANSRAHFIKKVANHDIKIENNNLSTKTLWVKMAKEIREDPETQLFIAWFIVADHPLPD